MDSRGLNCSVAKSCLLWGKHPTLKKADVFRIMVIMMMMKINFYLALQKLVCLWETNPKSHFRLNSVLLTIPNTSKPRGATTSNENKKMNLLEWQFSRSVQSPREVVETGDIDQDCLWVSARRWFDRYSQTKHLDLLSGNKMSTK